MMIHAWRLVREARAGDAFTGEGARLFGGRWNPVGTSTTYTSATRSLAALEVLVHQAERIPAGRFLFFGIRFPKNLITTISQKDLPANWRNFPPRKCTTEIGKAWIAAKKSPVLQVPGTLIPGEPNYLLNFDHPQAKELEIGEAEPFDFDPRLRRV
ncbi:MAG: RES family NAD+ phosphorylase [Terrimicrobiaceae bacterium]